MRLSNSTSKSNVEDVPRCSFRRVERAWLRATRMGVQMMRALLKGMALVFGITVFPTGALGQSGWFWQNPLPQGNELTSVATPAPNTIVAVGRAGTQLPSTDR